MVSCAAFALIFSPSFRPLFESFLSRDMELGGLSIS